MKTWWKNSKTILRHFQLVFSAILEDIKLKIGTHFTEVSTMLDDKGRQKPLTGSLTPTSDSVSKIGRAALSMPHVPTKYQN